MGHPQWGQEDRGDQRVGGPGAGEEQGPRDRAGGKLGTAALRASPAQASRASQGRAASLPARCPWSVRGRGVHGEPRGPARALVWALPDHRLVCACPLSLWCLLVSETGLFPECGARPIPHTECERYSSPIRYRELGSGTWSRAQATQLGMSLPQDL